MIEIVRRICRRASINAAGNPKISGWKGGLPPLVPMNLVVFFKVLIQLAFAFINRIRRQ
jgi:hypothetical protein